MIASSSPPQRIERPRSDQMPLPAPPNSEQDGSTPKELDGFIASADKSSALWHENNSLRDQLRVAREALAKAEEPMRAYVDVDYSKIGPLTLGNMRRNLSSALASVRSALSLLPKEGGKGA